MYAYLYGNFNFQATPLAPLWTKVVANIDPQIRGSWELNGEVGWYVGPAMDHYRCVLCYFARTRTTRVCDTIKFFPHKIPFLEVTLKDHLAQAKEDLVSIHTQPPTPQLPSLQEGGPVQNTLLDIVTQLKV